jgi:hypothetical protein
MTRRVLACLAVLVVLARVADARTFEFGAVTLGASETARLHVVNTEGGSVVVELVFMDTASKILATASEVLGLGAVKTLDIKAADVPGGIVVAKVVASHAVVPSYCNPVSNLQILDGKRLRDAAFVPARILRRGPGGNEGAAIGALRTLAKAQALFFDVSRQREGDTTIPFYAAGLSQLALAGLIPPDLAVPGYELAVTTGLYTFQVEARPSGINRTGDRAFYVDETGVIRIGVITTCDDPTSGGPVLSN